MREAAPNPPPGPARDALLAVSAQQVRANEDAITLALEEYIKRIGGVVSARVKGPKARKGTKWWADSATLANTQLVTDTAEVKALDADYAVPGKFADEALDAVRPVAMRIATRAAGDVAQRLGVAPRDLEGDGLFAIDTQAVEAAVDEAIRLLTGAVERHVQDLRKEVLDADANADSLDEMVERVEQANQRGGKWLLLRGRDLAHGLAQASALAQARSLGVRSTQWLSKRDERVRPTHVEADGQVRLVSDRFEVGAWKLWHPGDPSDLPESWEEIANCRCVLLFARPSKSTRDALKMMSERTTRADESVKRLLKAAQAAAPVPTPSGMSGDAAKLPLTEPVIGYRVLDKIIEAVPGQRLILPAVVAFGLVTPAAFTAAAPVLTVLIPAGTTVIVAGGAVALTEGAQLEVLAASEAGVEAQVVGA